MKRREFLVGSAALLASSEANAQLRALIGPSNPYPRIGTVYDVVVYGGTVAGITAAYTAKLNGAKVALVEPTAFLGGATGAAGLGQIDIAGTVRANIGGIWWQILQQIAIVEGIQPNGSWPTTSPASTTSTDLGFFPSQLLAVQPKNCAFVLNRMAFANAMDVYFNAQLSTVGGSVYPSVKMNGLAITGIQTNAGLIQGSCFIDASYEGDLLASVANAGKASYTFGREANSQYSETLNGVQKQAAGGFGSTVFYQDGNGNPIFPFVANTSASNGTADQNIQLASYRPTLMKISNGGVAFTAPSGYQDSTYATVGQIVSAAGGGYTTLSQACSLTALTGNKYCFNNPQIDYLNQSNAYADGTPSQRASIITGCSNWIKGFLYYCANSANVPAAFKADAATYGLAPDEFIFNGNWPYQMYIREGRRMVGSTVMIEPGIANGATASHPICLGSYVLDNHACADYADTLHTNIVDSIPGDSTKTGFQIPMEVMIPQSGQCTNLIVPVCISCSHVAWQALRYESQFAMMGEAAGIMAAKAVALAKSVQNLSYATDVLPGLTAINAKLS